MESRECTCKKYTYNYDPWCEVHGSLFNGTKPFVLEPPKCQECTCKLQKTNYDPWCKCHGSLTNVTPYYNDA